MKSAAKNFILQCKIVAKKLWPKKINYYFQKKIFDLQFVLTMKVKAIEDTSQFEFTTTINIATDTNECLCGKYNENGDLISPNGDVSFETTLHNGTKFSGIIQLFTVQIEHV